MFQTKKRLKERIFQLEQELENERHKNQIAEESGLAKCRGVIWKACNHSVSIEGPFKQEQIIGCDISTNCENFSRRKDWKSLSNVRKERL